MSALPPWPEPKDFTEASPYGPVMNIAAMADFNFAKAEAALARLRIAVEALRCISDEDLPTEYPDEYGGSYGPVAAKALSAIGSVPE